jgi:orotidine-5'-phosphate decarboxylase
MNRQELINQINAKQSFLCVGLDTDLEKIPEHLKHLDDPIFEFNKQIIDATAPYCVAYKPNIAFYEALGPRGWESLQKTINYIPKDIFTIADAKRGDIGNTANLYAKAFFETYGFDSITVAPYMGKDSVEPFLKHQGKWTILLGLTSNPGSEDFQQLTVLNTNDFFDVSEHKLYEMVIKKSQEWGNPDQLMFVVGATQSDYLAFVREIAPDNFFLVPGVGAQGGSLADVAKLAMTPDCGLLVNASRSIIYAGNDDQFAQAAGAEAQKMQSEMSQLLAQYRH